MPRPTITVWMPVLKRPAPAPLRWTVATPCQGAAGAVVELQAGAGAGDVQVAVEGQPVDHRDDGIRPGHVQRAVQGHTAQRAAANRCNAEGIIEIVIVSVRRIGRHQVVAAAGRDRPLVDDPAGQVQGAGGVVQGQCPAGDRVVRGAVVDGASQVDRVVG